MTDPWTLTADAVISFDELQSKYGQIFLFLVNLQFYRSIASEE